MSKSASSGPSQRQLRVGELVRHALADMLSRGEIIDPVIESHFITVPEVRMSPDLKLATCYVVPMGGKDAQAVVKALAANARYIRGQIARRVDLRYAPDLRFRIDDSFEIGDRVDSLLRSPEVRADLESAKKPDEDEA